MGGWQAMWARAREGWRAEVVLRTSVDAPWPEVRAQHLRSQHRTIPFVAAVNLVFTLLTAGVFRDDAGWGFLITWVLLQLLWAAYVVSVWWRRRRRTYHFATPWALKRVLIGTLCLSLLWSTAIWVWFSHASDPGRNFMVAIVVGSMCVGALALSFFASAVWTYLLPQTLATAASLTIFPRYYVEFELIALGVYVLVLCWFGWYTSRLFTAHVLAEQQVRASLRELELARNHLHNSEKLASLGALVAGVSHEVNTPLGVAVTACSSVADTLEQLHSSYAAQRLTQRDFELTLGHAIEGVGMLQNNLHRAAKLVASFKQTVISQVDDRLCDFEVMEALRTLLVSLQPVMRRVPVVPVLQGPTRLQVRSYPSALIQVLTNLLMNSALHAFEGVSAPQIVIELADDGDHWTLTYRDNGVGVAPALHQRIFEPFFTTRRGSGGTGLGLNIVYTLVTQRLGGRLEFTSDSAAGLCFRLELPWRAPWQAASEDDNESREVAP